MNLLNIILLNKVKLYILNRSGAKTTNELAEIRGISSSGISKLIKVLLDKEYVEQERNISDRRYYQILITDKGVAFLRRSEQFRNGILLKIQSKLTEEEISQYCFLCDKIMAGDNE